MRIECSWYNSWRLLFSSPGEAEFWPIRCDADWSRCFGYYTLTLGLLGVWCHITLDTKPPIPVESLGRES
jgi:hypothetical protein